MSEFLNFDECRSMLADRGWRTPNTYCNLYRSIEAIPAIYLFLVVERPKFDRALIAYVGMSKNLKRRMGSHEILDQLPSSRWTMTWFLPVRPDDLRKMEKKHIEEFDPPWNIVGRKRGVEL